MRVPDSGKGKEREFPEPRVFAISCGGGEFQNASFGVLLNASSEVVDFIKLNSIHGRDREAKDADISKLVDFLLQYEPPDVVTVAGWALSSRYLMDSVRQAVNSAFGEDQGPSVIFVNDDLARIYQNSKRAAEEFPSYPPLLKYCISLARCVQEPLFEYASLFNSGKEILYLKFHPLQDQVFDCFSLWNH